jgi:hypothetical protein
MESDIVRMNRVIECHPPSRIAAVAIMWIGCCR